MSLSKVPEHVQTELSKMLILARKAVEINDVQSFSNILRFPFELYIDDPIGLPHGASELPFLMEIAMNTTLDWPDHQQFLTVMENLGADFTIQHAGQDVASFAASPQAKQWLTEKRKVHEIYRTAYAQFGLSAGRGTVKGPRSGVLQLKKENFQSITLHQGYIIVKKENGQWVACKEVTGHPNYFIVIPRETAIGMHFLPDFGNFPFMYYGEMLSDVFFYHGPIPAKGEAKPLS